MDAVTVDGVSFRNSVLERFFTWAPLPTLFFRAADEHFVSHDDLRWVPHVARSVKIGATL